jgi:two-component system chemotaxis response regulator CheV
MVRIRSDVVTLVDLERYLYGERKPPVAGVAPLMMLLEFNNQLLAFRVDGVDRIVRASWNQGTPLPEMSGVQAPVTSIVLFKERMLLMLDFESIAAQMGIVDVQHQRVRAANEQADIHHLPIVFAEDSRMIREMISDELKAAGFHNLQGFADGQQAWDYLTRIAADATPENVRSRVAGIITDVEMPRVDGFSLTRRVREHKLLKQTPVVLFSSLVSRDNEKKGKQVGANAQVSKPRYRELIETFEKCLGA